MATRKALKGVLDNFLGTFTSRYSDYRGYWLFGFLIAEAETINFDLLTVAPSSDNGPVYAAAKLAARKFHEQLVKHGLNLSHLRGASVAIEHLPLMVEGQINGWRAVGYQVHISATAISDRGRRYQAERLLFVAPHNASVELRSARADENQARSGSRCHPSVYCGIFSSSPSFSAL